MVQARKIVLLLVAGFFCGHASENDSRFLGPVTLHGYHPFRAVQSIDDWPGRRQDIRDRILLAAGLLPEPTRTPLNAKRFGAIDRDGFRVERVAFESFPGHWVTGSLFTPLGESKAFSKVEGKRPGVLCPHGHWTDGRFFDLINRSGEKGVRHELAIGADRFESAARNSIIARCVQLARMGCVVFVYDMIGYADSVQLPDHRRGPRWEMSGSEMGDWGFVSPMATLYLQTNFGLQTWNSVRALDYLSELPEVDTDRLLVTGASGGATQTMVLSAIDDRVDAAFPAVMASTAMQGGCTCENSHYLRIGQGNIDMAAAVAPRPLGLTSADDWTVELEQKGHPDLVHLYRRLNQRSRYGAYFNTQFKHNFNQVSRAQMYAFANRHFDLGFEEPILERDFEYLAREDLSLFPLSDGNEDGEKSLEPYLTGIAHERELNQRWAEDGVRQLSELYTRDESEGIFDSNWLRRAWNLILRTGEIGSIPAEFDLSQKRLVESAVTLTGFISSSGDDPFMAAIHYPDSWDGRVLIRLRESSLSEKIKPSGAATVLVPELYGQGNSLERNPFTLYSGTKEIPEDGWQHSPVYFYGYNDSVFVRRVHDVVRSIVMVRDHPDWEVTKVVVEASGGLSAVAMAAAVVAGDAIDEVRVNRDGFQFASITDHADDYMVPGALRYGGWEGLAFLISADKIKRR